MYKILTLLLILLTGCNQKQQEEHVWIIVLTEPKYCQVSANEIPSYKAKNGRNIFCFVKNEEKLLIKIEKEGYKTSEVYCLRDKNQEIFVELEKK